MARSPPRFIKEIRSSGAAVQRSVNEMQAFHTYKHQLYSTLQMAVTLFMHPRRRDKLCLLQANTTLALGSPDGIAQSHRSTTGISRIHSLGPITVLSLYAKTSVPLRPICITRVMRQI